MEYGVPRYRTIQFCYRLLKEKDPETKISEAGLRQMAKRGLIPTIQSGRATLINLDGMLEQFAKGFEPRTLPEPERSPERERPARARERQQANGTYGGVRVIK